jgi:hypothetical protein
MFENLDKEGQLGAFEIMADRISSVVEAVNMINQVYPEVSDTLAPSTNNVVRLSETVQQHPTHDEYLRGLKDAA